MTYEEECASLVQDNDEHDDVMRDRAVKAWESACERADALRRLWEQACEREDLAVRRLARVDEALRGRMT